MPIPCKLNLSASQASKLRNGHPIQLKAEQIGEGDEYQLSESNVKKIVSALQKNKGCRIQLSAEEIEGCGLGKSIKKGIKKASKAVKSVKKVVKDVEHEYRDIKHELKDNHVGRKIINTGNKITQKLDQYAPLVEDIPVVGTAYQGLRAGAHAANASVKQGVQASSEIDRMGKSVSAQDLKRVGKDMARNIKREVVNANPQLKAGIQALKDINQVADAVQEGQGLGAVKRKINKAQKSVAKARLAPKITGFIDHTFAQPQMPHMSGGALVYEDNIRFVRPGMSAFNPPVPDVIPKSTKRGGSFKNGGSFTFGGTVGRPRWTPYRGGSFNGGSFDH